MYWITGILGLILAIGPYLFGYSSNVAALWTSILIGGATFIVSLAEALQADRQQWEYWTAAILGIAAIIAPFILGFGNISSAMWSSIALGVLIALFAGSKVFTTGRT